MKLLLFKATVLLLLSNVSAQENFALLSEVSATAAYRDKSLLVDGEVGSDVYCNACAWISSVGVSTASITFTVDDSDTFGLTQVRVYASASNTAKPRNMKVDVRSDLSDSWQTLYTTTDIMSAGWNTVDVTSSDYVKQVKLEFNSTASSGWVWIAEIEVMGNRALNPLPVGLTQYNVTPLAQAAQIKFTTESELNNDFFVVERASSNMQFIAIAKLKGAGNSIHINQYSYLDKKLKKGTYYYRVKQQDYDGTYTYSPVKSVSIKYVLVNRFSFYPNPANQQVTFVTKNRFQHQPILLFSATGVLINTIETSSHQQQIRFSVSHLNPGLYYVIFAGQAKKLIIHHRQIEEIEVQ